MDSFIANKALCGIPKFHVPPCHVVSKHRSSKKKLNLALFIVCGVGMCMVAASLVFIFRMRYKRKGKEANANDVKIVVIPERISYYDLLQATRHFDESNLLGVRSFGSVYRGDFRDGTVLAVKVFNFQSDASFMSYDKECEVLRNIRHRNLVKVISCCSNEDFKALVLECMPNGNLEKWLYSHNYCLDVEQRLNIMIDVASALEYLHHGYSTLIVHCDVKPSNVLLDEEMVAHVSDFGIAKLLDQGETKAYTDTLATLGYIAPEYGLDGLVSTKCDVYSFGVMLLETFTRKKPTDETFVGELSLKKWVEVLLSMSPRHVIDINVLDTSEAYFERRVRCISSILEVGLKCTADFPADRINMKEALAGLQKIKVQLLA